MSVKKFSINTYIQNSGEILPSVTGYDIKHVNQLRIVTEEAGNTNTIDIRVRIKGQSTFTTLTTITGSVNTVIDIETYDEIKLFCTNFDTLNQRVLIIAVGFQIQKSGAFEYPNVASFPPATGSGNFAWDSDNQIMYYDEPSSSMWIQLTSGGGGTTNYFPEIVKMVNAGEILAKSITLAQAPTEVEKTRLFIKGGPIQVYGDDFTVFGTTLTWNGLGLDGLIEENDKIFVTYN